MRVSTILLVLCVVILWAFYARKRHTVTGPYPPGPRKYPFLANLLDIPTSFEWETYARWGKEYSKYSSVFKVIPIPILQQIQEYFIYGRLDMIS